MSALCERFHRLPAPSPATALCLRHGSMRDYLHLSEHHYRSHRPATATRVLVYEDPRPSAAERFLRCKPNGQVVAVLVESLPSLGCAMRNVALHERYGAHLAPRSRAALLNDEVRCISRVVVDPRWRGLGLAVRLVKHALATPTTRYTEALAAMGHVNPFFERAGMVAYPRPTHPPDARLIAALARVGIACRDLALLDTTVARIDGLATADRVWLSGELRRWHGMVARRSRVASCEGWHEPLTVARDRLLFEPVYYLKSHEMQPQRHRESRGKVTADCADDAD